MIIMNKVKNNRLRYYKCNIEKNLFDELHTPVPFGHPADFLSDTQPESIRTASRF